MKDAVDLIDAMPSWPKIMQLYREKFTSKNDQLALQIVDKFADKFCQKKI